MHTRKKLLIAAAVLFVVGASEAYSLGLGIEGGLPLGSGLPGNNVMLSLKLDGAPLLGIGVGGFGDNLSIGVIADFWLIQEPFAGILGVYLGPGAYVGFTTGGTGYLTLGARLPIGLQVFIVKWLELFVEVAPSLGVTLANQPTLGWGAQGAFGLRFWFK